MKVIRHVLPLVLPVLLVACSSESKPPSNAPGANAGSGTPRVYFVEPKDGATVKSPVHLRFGIDFAAGHSPGLFLDQRENRSYVRHLAPKRLLNCFAFASTDSEFRVPCRESLKNWAFHQIPSCGEQVCR